MTYGRAVRACDTHDVLLPFVSAVAEIVLQPLHDVLGRPSASLYLAAYGQGYAARRRGFRSALHAWRRHGRAA